MLFPSQAKCLVCAEFCHTYGLGQGIRVVMENWNICCHLDENHRTLVLNRAPHYRSKELTVMYGWWGREVAVTGYVYPDLWLSKSLNFQVIVQLGYFSVSRFQVSVSAAPYGKPFILQRENTHPNRFSIFHSFPHCFSECAEQDCSVPSLLFMCLEIRTSALLEEKSPLLSLTEHR